MAIGYRNPDFKWSLSQGFAPITILWMDGRLETKQCYRVVIVGHIACFESDDGTCITAMANIRNIAGLEQ